MFLARKTKLFKLSFTQSVFSFSTQNATVPDKCPFTEANPKDNVPKVSLIDSEEDYNKARPFSEIPGPSALQLMYHMLMPTGKYYKMGIETLHSKMYEEYGAVAKFPGVMGRDPMVTLYDAKQVEKVFRNEGQWPERLSTRFFNDFRMNERPELFKGIGGLLNDQGQRWQETRTKVNPVMLQPKTVHRYVGVVDKIAADFVDRVRSIRDDKMEVPADFANEMNKWSLESIAYIALDQRLGLLTDIHPDSDGQKLIQEVHDFFEFTYELEVKPGFFKKATYKRAMKCLSSMTDIIISFIDKSIAEMEKKKQMGVGSEEEESVLEKLLKIDKPVAIIMALDMLMAGVDTTSNSVLTFLNLMAKNPEKQQTLRQEILEKLPNKDSPLTAEAMKNMPYLRACLKESQRLLPVVLGGIRKLPKNIVLGGFQVPKEYFIVISNSVMTASEENFERPDEFLPERFLKSDPQKELKATTPFAFLPFGYGPRMCVGKRLAELEMEALITRLIRNFEVEWHYPEIKYTSNILHSPSGDLKFRFVDVGK